MYGETKRDLRDILKKLCEMKGVQIIEGKICVDVDRRGNCDDNQKLRTV